jgi:hypothetical protein
MGDIKLDRAEAKAVLDSIPDLVARYAAHHGITSADCRAVLADVIPVIDPSRYGPGGLIGYIQQLVDRLDVDCQAGREPYD